MTNDLRHRCQSCGIPLNEADGGEDLIGKEKNGNNSPYCRYCYQNGVFINPDATLEDMVAKGVARKPDHMSEEEARTGLYGLLPRLARWAR